MKYAGRNHYHQQINCLITFWTKLYQGQGSKVRQKIWIGVTSQVTVKMAGLASPYTHPVVEAWYDTSSL